MRSVGLFCLTIGVLALFAATDHFSRAEADAAETAGDGSGLKTTAIVFDVLSDGKPVGSMDWHVMEVQDKVIFQVRFEIRSKDKPAGFESFAVYRTGQRPEPERIQATTRLGDFKLMEGEAVFAQADPGAPEPGRVAHLTVHGFADRDLKPFPEPREKIQDVPVPDGLVLTAPAFLYFGPRLLDAPGRVEAIVHAEVPDDIDFPAFLNLKTDCVLTRGEWDDAGRAEIVLAQRFPGDNYRTLAAVTVDREGAIVEARLGNFLLRPTAPAAAPPTIEKTPQ
ncbi:MAG: hypothetical protein WBD63_07385 [Phycisphaerae bacterium]|nr:hypothetical protein [Phycisphaerae bacterium]